MTEPQYSRSEDAGDPLQPNAEVWRKEIHSRVSRYRTRRGRRIEGAFSIRFPFPPAEPAALVPAVDIKVEPPQRDILVAEVATATEPVASLIPTEEPTDLAAEPVAMTGLVEPPPPPTKISAEVEAPVEVAAGLTEGEPEPLPVIQQRPRPKRKVIAFPRPTAASEAVHRLADPVFSEQPRILDVPEELEAFPSTPFLDGLQFGAAQAMPSASSEHLELPFRVVSRSQRVYAALVDCSLAAVGAVVFVFICRKMLPNLAPTGPVLLAAAVVPVVFWGIYQYVMLVYAGRTAGMQVANVRLSTFKGGRPSLRQRRNRVVGLYLSTASLIMGLLWAFVDVDALCWHDRISGTYLTKRE